jgi:hypothetical protein
MKLLHIKWAHPRNIEFIIRACKEFNIEYHYTDESSPKDESYDIIWAPSEWIDPDQYPTSKILFGPHFWVCPSPDLPLFTQAKPEHVHRCIFICLSDWINTLFNEFVPISKQIIPFVPLPFGLSVPSQPKNIEYDCIIYYKARHPSLLEFAEQLVLTKGLTYKIYRYGKYEREEYLSTLQKTQFAIWIGSHESQGFALEECLATNTPIYVYDVHSMKDEYVNGSYSYEGYVQQMVATSAPYWNDQCGIKVYSNEEFESRFQEFIEGISLYQPAAYVETTLTDRICFQRMLDRVGI